jgi:hypothetical protein
LFRVVASNEANQDVGINGAHDVCAQQNVWLPSRPRAFLPVSPGIQRVPRESPRT